LNGSIRSKGKNSWQLQIYTGRDNEGKRTRYFETVRGTRESAEMRLQILQVMVGPKISRMQEIRLIKAQYESKERRLLARIEELKSIIADMNRPIDAAQLMKLKPHEELRSKIGYRKL
jgi:hypothetical protein